MTEAGFLQYLTKNCEYSVINTREIKPLCLSNSHLNRSSLVLDSFIGCLLNSSINTKKKTSERLLEHKRLCVAYFYIITWMTFSSTSCVKLFLNEVAYSAFSLRCMMRAQVDISNLHIIRMQRHKSDLIWICRHEKDCKEFLNSRERVLSTDCIERIVWNNEINVENAWGWLHRHWRSTFFKKAVLEIVSYFYK